MPNPNQSEITKKTKPWEYRTINRKLEKFIWSKIHGKNISFYISGNNLAYIDEYFVKELGLYRNRSDFIRIAIKNQIHREVERIIFERENLLTSK